MPFHVPYPVRVAAAWTTIGLAGGLAGWLTHRARDAEKRKDLVTRVELAAVAFHAGDLGRLRGTREDVGTPAYDALQTQLRHLKRVDPRVRTAYILRVRAGSDRVIWLATSAMAGETPESPPGDEHPPALHLPGLQQILHTRQPVTEGPLSDDSGTWVIGYAALGDERQAGAADLHLLGLDEDAAEWRRETVSEGVERAVVVWVLLGIPLGAWLVTRRQREQNEVIRNLSEAMEQSRSAIMITDRAGIIEYANGGLCRHTGYARRELIGHSWRDFQASGQADAKLAEIGASLRAGTACEGEWYCQRKDGTAFPVRGGFSPVRQRDGTIASFVAVFDDIAETKRREVELQEATELAQAADRAKGQFLATMSHEVRTPLNGIVGFTSLLLETPLTAEQLEYVQTIRVSTEALIQLTGDILDFARIEAGRVKLDPVPSDPRECVEEALDLLAAKAAEKGLELLHRIEPEVPAALVVDSGRLRQVLVNLIGNAVKFTDHGEIEVTVARTQDDAEPAPVDADGRPLATLLFAVRDTGIGISPEHHEKLFRAFSQIDESTTRRFGGTGLGLAISRNLVSLMGGTIGVRSTEGAGSVFTFTIRAPVAAPAAPPHDLGGRRLALVAPPGALRRELAALLKRWGATLLEVNHTDALAPADAELALIDVSPDLANHLAALPEVAPGWAPPKAIGLVPISTTNDLRMRLRRHFRLLVNKPVHQEALFGLLAGPPRPVEEAPPPGEQFGLRILVAEDNPINWRLIQRVLENLGCQPTLAENGREVIDLLRQRPRDFDLLLLDMHMPVMDGLTTLTALRAGQAGAEVRELWTIALTADVREPQRIQAMQAGLNDFLAKPLNVAALEAALRRFRETRRHLRG